MALNQTLRPGLIQLRVLDLDKTLNFYKNILGLDEVARTSDGRVCLKTYDEFDHHSVTLRLADEAGLDFVSFKVDSEETLNRMAKETEAFGYPVEEIPANSDQPLYPTPPPGYSVRNTHAQPPVPRRSALRTP